MQKIIISVDHFFPAKIITKLGIEVKTEDTNGVTRLHHACNSGHVEIVRAFIEHCKVTNIVRDNYGWTPFDFALRKQHLPIIAMFEWNKDCNKICLQSLRSEMSLSPR